MYALQYYVCISLSSVVSRMWLLYLRLYLNISGLNKGLVTASKRVCAHLKVCMCEPLPRHLPTAI